jgi:ribosomal protein L37E
MNRDIQKIVNKVLLEELNGKIKNAKRRIFESDNKMCSECGYMKESEIQELGGMGGENSEHPKFGKKRLPKRMSPEEIEKLLKGDDEPTKSNERRGSRFKKSEGEMEEGFDDFNIKSFRKDKDFGTREFKGVPKGMKPDLRNLRDDSITPSKYMHNKFQDFKDLFSAEDDFDEYTEIDESKDTMCSECGSKMYEGECVECGSMKEYEMRESLSKKQRKSIDKNKNGKIDRQDFAMLRKGKKTETKEGKKFPDLSGDGKVTRKDVLLGRGVKLKGSKVEESKYSIVIDGKNYIFEENDMVDIIENIVLEEKKKKKKTTKIPNVTKDSQGKSKKENDDYLDSVVKKMKDYLKDGSKGNFEMNPKHFPKGNGELAKMSKKAYIPSDAVGEYIDNFTAAALENLDYDTIHPNEDWMDDLLVGASRTGNNPEWANAVETPNNKKRNKIRKDNLLAKVKKKAYNKAPQPVNDVSGENTDKASKILMQVESQEGKKVISDIEKMKNLISYGKKTQ